MAELPSLRGVCFAAFNQIRSGGISNGDKTVLVASRSWLAGAVVGGGAVAPAQEIKVGVVLPYTSVNAKTAQQMDRGMEMYLKLNADQVKPYTIKLIKRDAKNPGGADAKLAVQELLTEDKVGGDPLHSYSSAPSIEPLEIQDGRGTGLPAKIHLNERKCFKIDAYPPALCNANQIPVPALACAAESGELDVALDLLRGTATNAAFPPNPKAAVHN